MYLIGIAGGTGSGKTTVVEKIINGLREDLVTVIAQDSYYKDNSHVPPEKREEINFDHPSSIEFSLLEEHLSALKTGKEIQMPVYSYLTCTRSDKTVLIKPKKVVILEGILVLAHESLRDLIDLKIYIDAEADERLSRVICRDIKERGRDLDKILARYEKSVKPMHQQFIEPTKWFADIIIPGGGRNTVAIDMIKMIIRKKLDPSG
jgi:uridine kinase